HYICKLLIINSHKPMMNGDIITFGNHEWRVLHVKDDRVLIITEAIIALRWYHSKFVDITWADCELRNYLNNTFYQTFDEHEKEKIIAVTNQNPANPWFKTAG